MAHRTEKEKMLAGELYRAAGPEIVADAMRADRLLRAYNTTETVDEARRLTLLHELLGSVGKSVTVRSSFYCDYGHNISLGNEVFLNFGCVFLDVVRIDVGDGCKIWAVRPDPHRRSSAGSGAAQTAPGKWKAHQDRTQCMDRWRRDHPSRSDGR